MVTACTRPSTSTSLDHRHSNQYPNGNFPSSACRSEPKFAETALWSRSFLHKRPALRCFRPGVSALRWWLLCPTHVALPRFPSLHAGPSRAAASGGGRSRTAVVGPAWVQMSGALPLTAGPPPPRGRPKRDRPRPSRPGNDGPPGSAERLSRGRKGPVFGCTLVHNRGADPAPVLLLELGAPRGGRSPCPACRWPRAVLAGGQAPEVLAAPEQIRLRALPPLPGLSGMVHGAPGETILR